MTRNPLSFVTFSVMKIVVALAFSLSGTASHAGLGGAPSTLNPSSTRTSSYLPGREFGGYSETTKTLESGTVVREYQRVDGIVFAVSWSGPFLPDLQSLLGPYFDVLTSYLQDRTRAVRAPIVIRDPRVVIFSSGRLGAFEGRAWVTSLMPTGLTSEAIK